MEKEVVELEQKVYIATVMAYVAGEPYIIYRINSYEPVSTSMIIKFSEDNNYYYFETLHTIYKAKKESLYKLAYRNQLEELKAYLQCEDFKHSLEKFNK